MRSVWVGGLLVAASLATTSLPAHPVASAVAPGAAQVPVRILLMGDSLTRGRHGDFTWRYRLDHELARQGVAFDFVGPLTLPYVDPGYATSRYADPDFDQNHLARAGWQLRSMGGAVEAEVRAETPDIVVLEAGINDLLRHATEPDVVAGTATALQSWIAHARLAEPGLRIVLTQVLRVDLPAKARVNPLVARYDARLAALAAELTTTESPISVARTDVGWRPGAAYSYDGLHPNPTGETHIAQRVAETLHDVGVLPQAPHLFRVIPWRWTERTLVHTRGNRVTASWSRQAITGAWVRHRRAGGRWVTSARPIARGRTTWRLHRGRSYEFRVRLVRHRMTGPWGPVTRARVARRAHR